MMTPPKTVKTFLLLQLSKEHTGDQLKDKKYSGQIDLSKYNGTANRDTCHSWLIIRKVTSSFISLVLP